MGSGFNFCHEKCMLQHVMLSFQISYQLREFSVEYFTFADFNLDLYSLQNKYRVKTVCLV